MNVEDYFIQFKKNTIGENIKNKDNIKIIYADWAGSGRFYKDVEEEILNKFAPLYGNLHSQNTYIGNFIEQSYKNAKSIIKNHFGAGNDYAVISIGSGMTAAILKFQNIILNNIEYEKNKSNSVVFSSHKFLGGVGGTGILIVKKSLYKCDKPTDVGGGVVQWVNPWGRIIFYDDFETREETGTPAIIQTIKTSLAVKLKEKMGIEYIRKREKQITDLLFDKLKGIENIHIYDEQYKDRIGILSFNIKNVDYNSVVHKLSEEYGIQSRGGCCCASIYAHELLNIDNKKSNEIIDRHKYKQDKPGVVRISTNPIMSNEEIIIICNAIKEITQG